jgi:hypothetical protein
MALFMDVELVSVNEGEPPDAYAVALDVIYSGETWCRSLVRLSTGVAARLAREEVAVIAKARDALLELLELEPRPVSFDLRLTTDGTVILARASPEGAGPRSDSRPAGQYPG